MIHISSHSFTAELDGTVRGADVGLFHHPGRRGETEMCARWKESLAASAPELRVRRNDPYAGKGDGLTSHLRLRYAPSDYLGIELEIKPGHSPGRGPALDGGATRADRFVRHGVRRLNAP